MRQIDFYQIGQAGLEPVLLMLLKKTLAAKKKALILCPMPAASALDDALWSHDADSWIAHGLDDAAGIGQRIKAFFFAASVFFTSIKSTGSNPA